MIWISKQRTGLPVIFSKGTKEMHDGFMMALCQLKVSKDKKENIEKAISMLRAAALGGAQLAVLPEMFNCPYDNSFFRIYSENALTSETLEKISETARRSRIHVVAGSIPEEDDGRIFNTSFIFDDKGNIIAKHRKLHLFDVDIKNGIRFMESEVLTAGTEITVVETRLCTMGVAICYDMRFPELARIMALKGAELCVFPGAFNMTTGPAHWELLIRARALDNQVYVAAVSPARDPGASYVAYGCSMAADPWGDVIAKADENEQTIYAEIKKERITQIRKQLPLLLHRRKDLYQ